MATQPQRGAARRHNRAALPEAMEVSLVELAHGEMRVAVRSPNILADVERLNARGRPGDVAFHLSLVSWLTGTPPRPDGGVFIWLLGAAS